MSTTITRQVGNVANILNLTLLAGMTANIVAFAIMKEKEGGGTKKSFGLLAPFLDDRWYDEGFCAPQGNDMIETHFKSGLSMAGCIAVCIGIWTLFLRSTKATSAEASAEMSQAKTFSFFYLLGTAGHASGHFSISEVMKIGLYPPSDARGIDDIRENGDFFLKVVPVFIFFYLPLFKSYMTHIKWRHIAPIALISHIGGLFIPMKFGFAYVQAIVFSGSCLDKLFLTPSDEKGFVYAMWPIAVIFPSLLASIFESTTCSTALLMQMYGHSILDSVMVVSCGVFYLICWLKFNSGLESKITVSNIRNEGKKLN